MKKARSKLIDSIGKWKQAAAVGVTALLASGAFWWVKTGLNPLFPVPAYRALRVIDGDTFETTERQLIRLTGVDAPELENCAGPEAKAALEKLILNKNLYLKVIFRDQSNRLISHVYNQDGLVSIQIARLGLAYNLNTGVKDPKLDKAADLARQERLGVYSVKCTQSSNLDNPACVIKGNQRDPSHPQLYRFPGCGQYDNTLVQLSKGDKWFCTEKQAQKAGYSKGSDCFSKTWK